MQPLEQFINLSRIEDAPGKFSRTSSAELIAKLTRRSTSGYYLFTASPFIPQIELLPQVVKEPKI